MRTFLPLLALMAGCFVDPDTRVETLSSTDAVTRLVIDADAGAIDLAGGDQDDVSGTATFRWVSHEPTLDVHEADGVMTVVVDCPTFASFCSVDLHLSVPDGVDVDVHTGAGEVSIGDVATVRADTGSGAIGVADVAGDVVLDSGSGSLDLRDVGGDVDAETGSGSIDATGLGGARLTFDTGSGSVDVAAGGNFSLLDVHSGSGGLELAVPAGTYDVDAQTGSGTVDVHGVVDDPDATRRIRARTGTGSIAIRGVK